MHIPFFSEPEAVPRTKAIGHQLKRMLTYHETACGNKALSAAEPQCQPLQRREVLIVPPRCCMAGGCLICLYFISA